MKHTLIVSLTLNTILMGCLFIYHQDHATQIKIIQGYSVLTETWRTNAYTALGLAKDCWAREQK